MSEQLELLNGDEFNDPRVLAQRELSALSADAPAGTPYPAPSSGRKGPNPLYTSNAYRKYGTVMGLDTKFGEPEETFLPSYEIESHQEEVNPQSIRHMAENASGLGVPNISAYQFGDTTMVVDGNHRVNAALDRGQMLIPATLRKAYQ